MSRSLKIVGAGALSALLVLGATRAAAQTGDLYTSRAIVTGTGEVNRRLGLAQCLEDVLVKVSGDPRLIRDPRTAALARRAEAMVSEFRYRDRMADKPIHDEQGTRDRPHDLTVTFARVKIDAALRSLGRKPWTGARPRVIVFLAVDNGAAAYMLASDGERGADQREALAGAARLVALPATLPDRAALAASGVSVETLPSAELSRLGALAKTAGGDVALAGTLVWSEKALGWIATWRIGAPGKPVAWQVRGVNFDEAFRNGMRGAAQVLSGNGAPKK